MMLVVHAILYKLWWHDIFKRRLILAWFVLFIGLSVVFYSHELFRRALNGSGYVLAHLHGGLWRTGEEALNAMLTR